MATGKIGERALLQHELIGCGLAEAMTKIEAARWLTYRAAWLVDAGKMDPMVTAMVETICRQSCDGSHRLCHTKH